jgi:hypothetical protein
VEPDYDWLYTMPCYSPLVGYRSKYLNKSGKRSIVFNTEDGFADLQVNIACGQCIGCRLEYSRQWAMRIVHESEMHNASSFITLTYNNDNLPANHSISKREIQNFLKRLRKRIDKEYGQKIRFFACGEYGERKNRPHYHAIIFGTEFPDRELYSFRQGVSLFTSELLNSVWKKGYAVIGNVTFDSAAYVARYVMKKQKGTSTENEKYKEKYMLVDTDTGEIHFQEPEFSLMSRKPGLGKTWFEKYKQDTDKDYLVIDGIKMNLPTYYDSLLDEEDLAERKLKRYKALDKKEQKLERLEAKQKVAIARIENAIRPFEQLIK